MTCIYNKDGDCLLDRDLLIGKLGPCVDADVCDDRVDRDVNFEEDESE